MKRSSLLFLLIAFLIVLFSAFAFRYRIQGPVVRIDPVPATTTEQVLPLKVQSKNVRTLRINGMEFIPDFEGVVALERILQSGQNHIEIIGTDRYGSSVSESISVQYLEN